MVGNGKCARQPEQARAAQQRAGHALHEEEAPRAERRCRRAEQHEADNARDDQEEGGQRGRRRQATVAEQEEGGEQRARSEAAAGEAFEGPHRQQDRRRRRKRLQAAECGQHQRAPGEVPADAHALLERPGRRRADEAGQREHSGGQPAAGACGSECPERLGQQLGNEVREQEPGRSRQQHHPRRQRKVGMRGRDSLGDGIHGDVHALRSAGSSVGTRPARVVTETSALGRSLRAPTAGA